MEATEMQSLFEAYKNVYAQEQFSEEVEIAAHYFYEMGLNEEGVDILIEELGEEEFSEFVYDIAEEYVLTEARAGGARIEPVTAKGQKFKSGKPTGKSLERLRAQKAARRDAEEKSSASKPSGMKASLERQSAVAAAAKKQPKKPGLLDRVAGAVNRGIERHNAAMSAAKETGKTIRKAAGKVGGVAKEVGKGASGAARLAGHVARKGLSDEYLMGYLIDEGYAETQEAAYAILENMGEEWKQSIVEMTYGRRGSYRNAVGGADRNDGRNRYLGSATPSQAAQEKQQADAAAKRAVEQSRRRRAAEARKNNG